MSVDGEVRRLKSEADEPGWEVDPDDDWGVAVVATVGRQLRLRREAVGMRAAEFGVAVGYGEDLVYKIEGVSGFLGRTISTGRTRCWGRMGCCRR